MKNATKHIGYAFNQIPNILTIVLLFYLCNLLFSNIPGRLFKNYMNDQIGTSVEVDKTLHQFDYTMMTDFMIHYGSGISVIIGIALMAMLFYFLFHSFLMTGLVDHILKGYQKLHRNDFLTGAANYFFRFIRVEIFFFLLYALFFGIANFTLMRKGINPFELESDIELIDRFFLLNGIALVFSFLVRMWHEASKFYVVDSSNKWITASLKSGFRFVRKQFPKFLLIQLCFGLIIILLFGISYLILKQIDMGSTTSQWSYILIVQLFIILIIAVKVMKYFAIGSLYKTASQELS